MNTSVETKYPTLKEMGVESPHQIEKYHITSINAVDVLRLIYDRPDGSFLPSYRSYRFPRVQEQDASGRKKDAKQAKLRTHPKLLAAIEELDTLLTKMSSKESIKDEILDEIAMLEEDIAIRGERIKVLARRILEAD